MKVLINKEKRRAIFNLSSSVKIPDELFKEIINGFKNGCPESIYRDKEHFYYYSFESSDGVEHKDIFEKTLSVYKGDHELALLAVEAIIYALMEKGNMFINYDDQIYCAQQELFSVIKHTSSKYDDVKIRLLKKFISLCDMEHYVCDRLRNKSGDDYISPFHPMIKIHFASQYGIKIPFDMKVAIFFHRGIKFKRKRWSQWFVFLLRFFGFLLKEFKGGSCFDNNLDLIDCASKKINSKEFFEYLLPILIRQCISFDDQELKTDLSFSKLYFRSILVLGLRKTDFLCKKYISEEINELIESKNEIEDYRISGFESCSFHIESYVEELKRISRS